MSVRVNRSLSIKTMTTSSAKPDSSFTMLDAIVSLRRKVALRSQEDLALREDSIHSILGCLDWLKERSGRLEHLSLESDTLLEPALSVTL